MVEIMKSMSQQAGGVKVDCPPAQLTTTPSSRVAHRGQSQDIFEGDAKIANGKARRDVDQRAKTIVRNERI